MVAQQTRPARDVVRVAAAAAVGGFLFGYDTGVVNGSVPAIATNFGIGPGALGFVVSAALLGCAVGAWFAVPISDRMGRTRLMLLAGVVFAVGSIGAALSFGPLTLTYWRVVQGLAIGASIVMAAAYIAEIAPAPLRGRLGSFMQLAIVSGIVVSLLIALGISAASGGAEAGAPWGGVAWRWMFAVAAVPGLAFAILATRIPESPRYLIGRGLEDQARGILDRFVDGDVPARLDEIRRSLGGPEQGLKELRGPRFGLLPVVWTGILLAALQQFVGINVVFYYSTTVWQAVGFGANTALLTSLITGIINLGATIAAVVLIDRVGRRRLLLAGSAGMAVTLLALAITFGTGEAQEGGLRTGASVLALIAANLYVVSFAISWGPVTWALLGEMFAGQIRASALAVVTAVNWLANWLVSASFPALAKAGLPVPYGLFTAFAVVSLLFVYRTVGESRGRELAEP